MYASLKVFPLFWFSLRISFFFGSRCETLEVSLHMIPNIELNFIYLVNFLYGFEFSTRLAFFLLTPGFAPQKMDFQKFRTKWGNTKRRPKLHVWGKSLVALRLSFFNPLTLLHAV